MAQQRYKSHKQKKSDFPIFEYLDRLMPQKLVARFMEMPRHVRWTLISAVASMVLLWVALKVVVGGLNSWIDSQGEFLYDAYYLPYPLSDRPLPVYPEAAPEEDRFLILPHTIADQYVLQIPPTGEELEVIHKAELDAFLALSQPAQDSLTTLRQSLGAQIGETVVATEMVETAVEVAATATIAATVVPTEAAPAEAVVSEAVVSEAAPTVGPTVAPTVAPTVDPVQVQINALDKVLASLVPLNEALQDDVSIDLVYGSAAELQNHLTALAASGITMPAEVEPFSLRISELAALKPPIKFRNSECLMAALAPGDENGETSTPPCAITRRAMYVEQGDYINTDGASLNVVVAEFPRPVDAAWAVKQLFYRARKIGYTGNFALNDIIAYNYFFSQIDGIYTLAWSHENWVYSISGWSNEDIDRMVKVFPY